jgi:hypothetical protein
MIGQRFILGQIITPMIVPEYIFVWSVALSEEEENGIGRRHYYGAREPGTEVLTAFGRRLGGA